VVGALCVGAGWSWGAILIAFFVASTLLSRAGAERKERRVGGIVAKGGERDATQVLANGGVYAAAALASMLAPGWPGWTAVGAAALAAATADTWATEVGTLVGGVPRAITSLRPVPPGTSGGVTVAGTLASLAGAGFVAALAWWAGWPGDAVRGAAIGGFAGATADSLLGATMQARRWCDRCAAATERAVHACGTPTRAAGGLVWLDNDRVNLAATVVGAGVGALLAVG